MNGDVELLAAPVTWGPDSNRTAFLVAEAAMDNYEAHGFTVSSSRNCVLIKAPPGHGASAPTAGTVVVTPTGDVTTYDVKPMGGGRDPGHRCQVRPVALLHRHHDTRRAVPCAVRVRGRRAGSS